MTSWCFFSNDTLRVRTVVEKEGKDCGIEINCRFFHEFNGF